MATISESYGLWYDPVTGIWVDKATMQPVPEARLTRYGIKNGDPTDPEIPTLAQRTGTTDPTTGLPSTGGAGTNPRAVPDPNAPAPAPTQVRDPETWVSSGAPPSGQGQPDMGGAYAVKIPTQVDPYTGEQGYTYAWYYPGIGRYYLGVDEWQNPQWGNLDKATAESYRVNLTDPSGQQVAENPNDPFSLTRPGTVGDILTGREAPAPPVDLVPFGGGGGYTPAPPRDTGPALPGGDVEPPDTGADDVIPDEPPPEPPPPTEPPPPPPGEEDPTEDPLDKLAALVNDYIKASMEGPTSIAPPDPMDSDILDAIKWARLKALSRLGYKETFINGPRGIGGPTLNAWMKQLSDTGGISAGNVPGDGMASGGARSEARGTSGVGFDAESGSGTQALPSAESALMEAPENVFDRTRGDITGVGGFRYAAPETPLNAFYGTIDQGSPYEASPTTPKDIAEEQEMSRENSMPSADPTLSTQQGSEGGATTMDSEIPAPGAQIARLYPNRQQRDRGLAYW